MVELKHIILGSIAATAVVGVGYLVYFDQKRQKDPKFRKDLKKQRKAAAKAAASRKASEESLSKNDEATRASAKDLLAIVQKEAFPTSPEAKEAFFMEQLQLGETAFRKGPSATVEAALHFFRALKIYPQPMELLMIFQKTVPEPVFELVMSMMAEEINTKQNRYNEVFPPDSMNIKITETQTGTTSDGKKVIRRGLKLTKDVKKDEVIYTETPIIAAVDPVNKSFCAHCLKKLPTGDGIVEGDYFNYCCKSCKDAASEQYESILSPLENPDVKDLLDYCVENNARAPLIVAKFLAKMVWEEKMRTDKVLEGDASVEDEYTSWDHLEKLHYLDLKEGTVIDKTELEFIRKAIGAKVPGFDEFLTYERYLMIKGKFLYNSIGVHTDSSDDANVLPTPSQTPPSTDDASETSKVGQFSPLQSRTSRSLTTRIGSGMFQATAYLAHSCAPNVRYEFEGDQLKVVALQDMSKGEEIFNSWVELKGCEDDGEDRRGKLSRRFRLQCKCTKCEGEKMATVE